MKETLYNFIDKKFKNAGYVSYNWWQYLIDTSDEGRSSQEKVKLVLQAIVEYIDTTKYF